MDNTSRGGKRLGAGRKPISPNAVKVTISYCTTPEIVTRLDELCKATKVSRSSLVNKFILDGLGLTKKD